MAKPSLLFLGKKNDEHCERALRFAEMNFATTSFLGEWGDPLPEGARNWEGDFLISYLSRWVVPAQVLARAAKCAINFHPASPRYPGIGCNNFALYEGAAEYGVTCHFMSPKVDTGEIIATRTFPVLATDTVASLLERTYAYQLFLYYEIAHALLQGETLKPSGEEWARPAYTRREFEDLRTIRSDMPASEIERRVRATSFGPWQPELKIEGFVFKYSPDQ